MTAGNGSSNMQGTSNEGYEANEKPDERNTYFMAEINVPDSNNVSVTPGPRMQKALPFRRLLLTTVNQLAPVSPLSVLFA